MRVTRLGRVVAVVAAALLGCALTAWFVVPRLLPGHTPFSDGTAAGLVAGPPSGTPSTTAAVAPSSTGPGDTPPSPPGPAVASATTETSSGPPPTRLVMARLGIDMTVQAEGVDGNGQMALPPDPAVAGWYQWGSAPQDAAGAAVLAAHVDSKTHGVGPFVRLGSARTGDEVDVWVGATKLVYRVSQVAAVAKVSLDGDGLFTLTGAPRLHLVTCTGAYVKGSGYTQNLVVVADRVPTP